MDQRIKDFFLRYETANSSSNVSGAGELYAETFMFGRAALTQFGMGTVIGSSTTSDVKDN